jgi:hypothetical protein
VSVMVTAASGTTAPLASFTTPRIVPVGAWATQRDLITKNNNTPARLLRRSAITHPRVYAWLTILKFDNPRNGAEGPLLNGIDTLKYNNLSTSFCFAASRRNRRLTTEGAHSDQNNTGHFWSGERGCVLWRVVSIGSLELDTEGLALYGLVQGHGRNRQILLATTR